MRPRLPASKPKDLTDRLLKLEENWLDVETESQLSYEEWDEEEGRKVPAISLVPAGRTFLPTEDLGLLWADRSDWRQYAPELERRGLWKKRKSLQPERAAPSRALPSGKDVR